MNDRADRAWPVDVGLFLGLIVLLIGYPGNPAGETPPKNESLEHLLRN